MKFIKALFTWNLVGVDGLIDYKYYSISENQINHKQVELLGLEVGKEPNYARVYLRLYIHAFGFRLAGGLPYHFTYTNMTK